MGHALRIRGGGDSDSSPPSSSWPNLVGMTGEEATQEILKVDPTLAGNVHVVPENSMVTMDFREDRVRLFVNAGGKIVNQPTRG